MTPYPTNIPEAVARLKTMRDNLTGAVNRYLRADRHALEIAIAALEASPHIDDPRRS